MSVRMKAPVGSTKFCYQGTDLAVGDDGYLDVEPHMVATMLSHGYTVAPAAPISAPVRSAEALANAARRVGILPEVSAGEPAAGDADAPPSEPEMTAAVEAAEAELEAVAAPRRAKREAQKIEFRLDGSE